MWRRKSSTFLHVLEVSQGIRYLPEIRYRLSVHPTSSMARLFLSYFPIHGNNLPKLPTSSWVLEVTLLSFFHIMQPIGPSYKYICLAQLTSWGLVGIWALGLGGDSSKAHYLIGLTIYLLQWVYGYSTMGSSYRQKLVPKMDLTSPPE